MSLAAPTTPWSAYSPEERERHYNPRIATPGIEKYDVARVDVNKAGLAWPGRKADIAYGPNPLENLDLYLPESGTGPHPVHIFIHGGYWRARDKVDFGYIGAALARQGLLAAVINYPLCPIVTLDEVVAAARRAFAWVSSNIAEHGGDPDRITISGHSAGAHLGASIIAHDWSGAGLGGQPLKAAVLVSGIYDPTPTGHLAVNAEIGITPALAERHNYANHPPRLNCPVHVIVGGSEPQGWIDQSADYANHIHKAGLTVDYTISPNENHFSLSDQFANPKADVLSAILGFAHP